MIAFDRARQAILDGVRQLATEKVALQDALGRIIAEAMVADADAVPFSRSAMDGYAVRSADCSQATQQQPVALPVAGHVFCEKGESALQPGTALSITTGAPLPIGADAVIPHEETTRRKDTVLIFKPVTLGEHIFPPAEDIHHGDVLATVGQRLGAGTLALLAFAGRIQLTVFQRPRVAILCTGDELVDPSATPAHGQVRNSNAVALAALVAEAGGEPRSVGTAPDDPATLAEMLDAGRHDCDLLITTGGASAGERDVVKRVLTELGARFIVKQVAMRPGRPFGFALWRDLPVCVLPGNPTAAFVCFQQLVRPALARMSGVTSVGLPRLYAHLHGELRSRPGRRYFVLARLDLTPDGFVVSPLENQCSALVRTAADANALIILPESDLPAGSSSRVLPGALVEVEVIDWPRPCHAAPEIV